MAERTGEAVGEEENSNKRCGCRAVMGLSLPLIHYPNSYALLFK